MRDDREKDILLMSFVIQISVLAEILESDAVVPLLFAAVIAFVFLVLKEVVRRVAEHRSNDLPRGGSRS